MVGQTSRSTQVTLDRVSAEHTSTQTNRVSTKDRLGGLKAEEKMIHRSVPTLLDLLQDSFIDVIRSNKSSIRYIRRLHLQKTCAHGLHYLHGKVRGHSIGVSSHSRVHHERSRSRLWSEDSEGFNFCNSIINSLIN